MSVHKYTYLMTGIRIEADSGIIDTQDDSLLPYIEGRPGVDLSIQCGEGSKYIYVGVTHVDTGPYSDELSFEVKNLPNPKAVAALIEKHLGIVRSSDVKLWLFELYH